MMSCFLANAAKVMTLAEAWKAGGFLMWVLLFMSVVGATFSIYFLVALQRRVIAPVRVRKALTKALVEGDRAGARRICEEVASPLSTVVLTTMETLQRAPKVTSDLVTKVAESEGARQADQIQGQTQWLLDIATLAPMVGLLGTVLGMLRAFGGVASDVAAAKPELLASGVSEAIITTIFGLIVAIPAMAAYAYFRRRAGKLVAELESACMEVIALLGFEREEAPVVAAAPAVAAVAPVVAQAVQE